MTTLSQLEVAFAQRCPVEREVGANSRRVRVASCLPLCASGVLDSHFTLMMIEQGRSGLRWGFALVNQPGNPINVVTDAPGADARQSNGGRVQYIHRATGLWDVLFRGLARGTQNVRETIMVAAAGTIPANCQVEFWNPFSGADLGVIVRCFNRAIGIAMDVPFTILLLE
jgi:hypothetical protein